MLVETLIFSVIAFALFVYIFYRLIKENDTKYVTILAIEALRNSNKIYNYNEYFIVFLWLSVVFLMIDALLIWKIFRIFN